MCDYRLIGQQACRQMPLQPAELRQHLGNIPYRVLIQAMREGRAHQGNCLYSGQSLLAAELSRSHYMTPSNWQRHLAQLSSNPSRCGWCGGQLSVQQIAQHQQPHRHNEQLDHHFHEQPGLRCFSARLLAVGLVFGDVQPSAVQSSRARRGRGQRMNVSVVVHLVRLMTNARPSPCLVNSLAVF
jgi:hypothetical protein